MADVSTITANGITYNVKDSTARTDIGLLESEVLTKQSKIISKSVSISAASTAQNIGVIANDPDITVGMIVIESSVAKPSCQTSDWTITTSDGGLTVYGTSSNATTVTLILAET